MSPHKSPAQLVDSGAESSTSESDDELEMPVESLVFGRSKRATAGNRLSNLLEKEGDDDLELLFAEDAEEEDIEFDDVGEDASDVQLDSSSDDDDHGPAKADDDMDGEKELQKQLRTERQKKRKAQETLKRPSIRKRIKLDPISTPTAPKTPATRPKKKSERVSWIPTPDEGPTRQSSRKQTMQNKEIVHSRMIESEKKRVQQIHVMEAAAKRKEASKPKAMTQADRLEEAARTERRNAKSLNRWEESEKRRVEEQRAKLEALQNRQVQGPVLTWWSGMAKWINGKLEQMGINAIRERERSEDHSRIGPKSSDESLSKDQEHDSMISMPNDHGSGTTNTGSGEASTWNGSQSNPVQAAPENPMPSTGLLDGIHEYAFLPNQSSQSPPVSREPFTGTADWHISPPKASPYYHASQSSKPTLPILALTNQPSSVSEISTRNIIILQNIDTNALKIPELQNHTLLKKRIGKLPSTSPISVTISMLVRLRLIQCIEPNQEQCVITGRAAKCRDPKTGLPYLDSYAYKEIQKLRDGAFRWSDLLGCYVGPADSAARGVPAWF